MSAWVSVDLCRWRRDGGMIRHVTFLQFRSVLRQTLRRCIVQHASWRWSNFRPPTPSSSRLRSRAQAARVYSSQLEPRCSSFRPIFPHQPFPSSSTQCIRYQCPLLNPPAIILPSSAPSVSLKFRGRGSFDDCNRHDAERIGWVRRG